MRQQAIAHCPLLNLHSMCARAAPAWPETEEPVPPRATATPLALSRRELLAAAAAARLTARVP